MVTLEQVEIHDVFESLITKDLDILFKLSKTCNR